MKKPQNQDGFILPVVLTTMLVVGVMAGGMLLYVVNGARIAGVYTTASQCRMSAQSALDQEAYEIYQDYLVYYQANTTSWDVLAWYRTYSAQSVGVAGYTSALMQNQAVNGCQVTVSLLNVTETATAAAVPTATLTLSATASCRSPSGVMVSKTIQEDINYSFTRSSVFDYAYFVNNFGWFQGGGVTANGDIRANGNLQLDGSSWVNGDAFAAINGSLGNGIIYNTARNQTLSQYWAANNQRARPTSPTASGGETWSMGYDGTSSLNAQQSVVDMPFLGNLDTYRQAANSAGSSIKQNGKVIVDACYSGVGPSGITNGADQGCLVLDGTSRPLIIDGPVVVDGDVIIKGTVKGQGAIYSGRNIYIVGNITYSDEPTWSKPDTTPTATVHQNENADMLGLAAKGNIVLGNYTSSSWLSNVRNYITSSFVNSYACDASDASIGYNSIFDGDYTAYDGGKKIEYTYNWWTKKYEYSTSSRRYYESSIGNTTMGSLASGSSLTRIDAVLYNNHAVMGQVGACQFNGSLVCRDEAIIYQNSVTFNWDIRLGSQSQDGLNVFVRLPMSPAVPRVVSWQEIQP